MEIHRPKPFHSWREFLKEYGIIVLGVITALGGEQAVEAIHHHHQVQEVRGALTTEMKGNVSTAKYNIAQIPCSSRRLDELQRWVVSWRQGKPLHLLRPVNGPPGFIFGRSSWRATPPDTFARMPLEQRIDFSAAYDGVDHLADLWDQSYAVWADLHRLTLVRHLSDDQLAETSADIDQLRGIYGAIKFSYQNFWVDRSKRLGVDVAARRLPADAKRGNAKICQPLLDN